MKACVLEAVGNLVYKEVEKPVPKEGEVLVKIKACGICSSDIDRVFKTGTYHFPTIPGHEFAGVIEELGKGVDESLLGKKAAVFPLLPCKKCPSCLAGEYARCDNYNYFGSRCDGGFAQYIAVPVWNLVLMNDDMPYTTAALCEPAAVALHAIERAEFSDEDSVVIVGTGTIAFLISVILKSYGAKKIIMIGRNSRKLEVASKIEGLTYIDSSKEGVQDIVWKLTDNQGADVVIESVGSSESIGQSLCLVKKGGHVVLMGNPAGDIHLNRNDYWKILRNELYVRGTWNSSYNENNNNWKKVIKILNEQKEILDNLITAEFSLSEHEQAFNLLRDKKHMTLKVMFVD